jgi:glycosyltransferase involved in cell wall biosynthesis
MRIVIYTHEFFPFAGGIATYNYELACGLCECGHQVVIVAPEKGEVDTTGFPFEVEWVQANNFKCLVFRVFQRLRSLKKTFKPDLYLASEHYAQIVTSVFRLFVNVPCIPIIHGSEIIRQTDRRNLFKRFLAWEMNCFYRKAHPVICISHYTRSLFLDAFKVPSDNVVVVHNGMKNRFDASSHDGSDIRARWNLSPQSTVLLTLARLTPRKGQDTIIKALPGVLKINADVVYICAGTGDYRDSLELLASELGVADHVIFPGRVEEEEKYLYYAACDMFVMPSREDGDGVEGFGLSFLEAWHASKPVLGSTHGGVVEVIEDGVDGVAVDPHDVDLIASTINGLLNDPALLMRMGDAGQLKAKSRFTDVAMAQGVISAIKF